jgi:hypothetical protein
MSPFLFGASKSAQDATGINLFVLILGTRGTIAAGHTLKPKARAGVVAALSA